MTLSPAVPDSEIALAHDYLLVLRGAERTFASMADIWPQAPIYTLLYDADGTRGRFANHVVQASRLQGTGATQSSFRKLLPLFPAAASSLSLEEHPLVVSSSSAFAHGVKTAPGAVHVCYCHSPFRYAWFERARAMGEVPAPLRPALSATLAGIRQWDRRAASRVTHYVANSRHTQQRIREFYGRDSAVIYPPVEVDRFEPAEPDDYFLMVSEIVGHKRVEQAAQAAVEAGQPLKVVGSGPDLERLRARYDDPVQFVGRVDDAELDGLYGRARAVVVPNVEEFGIVPVEGQAAGTPVLAARAGGALETVVDGVTGQFFEPDDVGGLTRLMRDFDDDAFDADTVTANAQRFSTQAFQENLLTVVDAAAEGAVTASV